MLGTSILISLATVVVSLMGFLSQIALAWRFGASSNMDVYLVGASIPMFVAGIFIAALSYSLVPSLLDNHKHKNQYPEFAGSIFIGIMLIAILMTVIGGILSPWQIEILGGSFTVDQRDDGLIIARISWLTGSFILMVGYLKGLHNAKQNFLLPTLISFLPPFCMILAVIILPGSFGLISIAWTNFFGFLLSFLYLLIDTHKDMKFSAISYAAQTGAIRYFISLPLVILSMLCFTAFQLVDSYWAPQTGTGSLTYLTYCQRLVVSIGNLVIAGPSTVMFPMLSKALMERCEDRFYNDTLGLIRTVISYSAPISVTVSILAEPIVIILFERGAFERQDTLNVASLLPWMMLGMVPMLCVVMIFRALYARKDVTLAVSLGALTVALYYGLSSFLINKYGLLGIAFAYASTWWIVFFVTLWRFFHKSLDRLICKENIIFVWRMTAIIVILGFATIAGSEWINNAIGSKYYLGIRIFCIQFICMAIYFIVATKIFIIHEIRLTIDYVLKHISSMSNVA